MDPGDGRASSIDGKKVVFDSWPRTANFLARQITDDLVAAGLINVESERFAFLCQVRVEETLLRWPFHGRDKQQ